MRGSHTRRTRWKLRLEAGRRTAKGSTPHRYFNTCGKQSPGRNQGNSIHGARGESLSRKEPLESLGEEDEQAGPDQSRADLKQQADQNCRFGHDVKGCEAHQYALDHLESHETPYLQGQETWGGERIQLGDA
jgi:hypothetical protein